MPTQPYHLTLPQSLHCSLSITHFELRESLNQFSQLSIQATSVQELDFISLIGQQGLFSIQAVSADVVGLGATFAFADFSWASVFLRTIVPFCGRNHLPFDFV